VGLKSEGFLLFQTLNVSVLQLVEVVKLRLFPLHLGKLLLF